MQTKLVIWDYNGCLLNDIEQFYGICVSYIFRHFALDPPGLEAYRAQRHSNPLDFYLEHGVPPEQTLKTLDVLVRASTAATPYAAPLFADVIPTLLAIEQRGIEQVIVSGCEQAVVEETLLANGVRQHFSEVIGDHRDKTEVFQRLLEQRGLFAFEVVGVTDTDRDAAMLAELGIKPYACSRGYHCPERLLAFRPNCPSMVIISDLAGLPARLR